jgi:hypothetical protein
VKAGRMMPLAIRSDACGQQQSTKRSRPQAAGREPVSRFGDAIETVARGVL